MFDANKNVKSLIKNVITMSSLVIDHLEFKSRKVYIHSVKLNNEFQIITIYLFSLSYLDDLTLLIDFLWQISTEFI